MNLNRNGNQRNHANPKCIDIEKYKDAARREGSSIVEAQGGSQTEITLLHCLRCS